MADHIHPLYPEVVCRSEQMPVIRVDGVKTVFGSARQMEGVRGAQEQRVWCFQERTFDPRHHLVCQIEEDDGSRSAIGFELAGYHTERFPAGKSLADLAEAAGVKLCPAVDGAYKRIAPRGTRGNLGRAWFVPAQLAQVRGVKVQLFHARSLSSDIESVESRAESS